MGDSQPSGSNGGISQLGDFESLLHAAEEGDVEKIQQILSRHATKEHNDLLFSNFNSKGELPLHISARCGHRDALYLLLPASQLKGFINVQTKKGGLSALHLAAICGQMKFVELLVDLSSEIEVDLKDDRGFTPLHLAVASGHKEVVGFLVSQGADLSMLNKDGMFPASFCKDSAMFDAVLSDSLVYTNPGRIAAIARAVDAENRTYLHYAAEFGSNADVITGLLREADPDQVCSTDKYGDSFLHVAAKAGNMNVLQALEAFDMAGFMKNDEHDPLNSPGMYALSYDHREFFDKLVTLDRSVKITLRSIIQMLLAELIDKPQIQPRLALFASTLPTYLALYAKKTCILEFLLETKVLSLSQWDDEYKRTCLHWAVVDKRIDIVQKLCSSVNLWPGIQDRAGKTARQLAFERNNHMVTEILSGEHAFKELEEKLNRERGIYAQALNAILVGAALIASVTFAGWLQPPFAAEFRSLGMKIYWASNSLSFFTSVATMCITTTALLPRPSRYVGDIVNQLQLAIVIDAGLLALSLAAFLVAFAAAGFAALRTAHIFAYQGIMRSTTFVGASLCLIVWLAFVVHLCTCTPPKSILCALVLPSLTYLGSSETSSWWSACLRNLRDIDVGDRSRSGYASTKTRDQLKALMGEDLVACRASELNPKSVHAPPDSNTIPLEEMKQLLRKLDVSDKEKFVVAVHKQREADIAYKQRDIEGAITGIGSHHIYCAVEE